jgi:hypothetical protein
MCAYTYIVRYIRTRAVGYVMPAVAILAMVGCGGDPGGVSSQEAEAIATGFDRHLVLPDEALTDADALTANQIQDFLEHTPYGNRSVLADHVSHGTSAANAIANASSSYGISPVVLLARLQLEQSLIGKSSASSNSLAWAMGCGCPDGGGCVSAFKGFDRQVECAAERFNTYLAQLDQQGSTIAGWAVNKTKTTLDGYSVRPRNAHTAALFTYTPWVNSAKDFLQIYRRYADELDYAAPAPGGCPSATFPTGVRIQLRPDAVLADQLGTSSATCFLDAQVAVDHDALVSHDPSVKLAANFRLSEFVSAATHSRMKLAPNLVGALQDTRQALGSSITVEVAFTTPDEQQLLCDSGDDPLCEVGELAAGTGVIVSSGAGNAKVLEAASSVGVPTCWLSEHGAYLAVGDSALGCPM